MKVFLLEYHTNFSAPTVPVVYDATNSVNNKGVISYSITSYHRNERQLKQMLSAAAITKGELPSFTDWQYIRSPNTGYYVPKKLSTTVNGNQLAPSSSMILQPYQLQWPPVLTDFTIPPQDGFDKMPYSGLKVPRFWKPKDGDDVLKIGTKVNGEETIFLMIASYRDFQCRETIASAFSRADHPERLYIGAVDQVVPGDVGCLDLEVPCVAKDTRPICIYKDHISIYKMDASTATGPVTARHIGDRLYRGQYFVMQMDAHCPFTRHWDTSIISQWKQTHNEMAVLSSYLTDVQGSIDGNGDSTRDTRPIMCNSDYEGAAPARYLRHGSQPEEEPIIRDMPQMQPFWAAGFSFSRGHFKVQVPYDAYQPMVFQGEEIAIGK